MEKIVSEIEMADLVLSWICENKIERLEYAPGYEKATENRDRITKQQILKGVKERHRELGTPINSLIFHDIFDSILDKLVFDTHITKDGDYYQKKFSGILFEKNGGYYGNAKKEKSQKRSQTLKDVLLISGSWVASIAGSGLLFFEYIKLNHHYPYGLHFWKIAATVSILVMLIYVVRDVAQRIWN